MKLSEIVQHISPSSVSTWLEDKGLWYLRYVLKHTSSSAAMVRGNCVEAALLMEGGAAKVKRSAEASYDLALKMANVNADVKEREAMLAIIDACYERARDLFGKTELMTQVQVNIEDERLSVPIKGFIDVETDSHVYDIKSTLRMPSGIEHVRRSHWRQLAVYHAATSKPCSLIYASKPTKSHDGFSVIQAPQDFLHEAYDEFIGAAQSLERAVNLCENLNDLKKLCFPNMENYAYDDQSTYDLARETWEF